MRPEERWRTDKILNGYHPVYAALAVEMTGRPEGPAQILEIGAADGAGMVYFRDLFEARVVGVEVLKHRVEACRALGFECIHTTQTSPTLPQLAADLLPGNADPGWDLIVDDASHDTVLTGQTLELMWPTLRPGGVYVIEDWNLFSLDDTRAMWANLYQRVLPWLRGSGALRDVRSTTVRNGLVILRKVGG